MDGYMEEMKARMGELGPRLKERYRSRSLPACLQMIMLLAENEGMLWGIVDESDRVCKRRKLRVITEKSEGYRTGH